MSDPKSVELMARAERVIPDRMFWAQPEGDEGEDEPGAGTAPEHPLFDLPAHDTKH
jgi:hydroxymethylpyrimidine/phosphomethylpyrimidine kinase